MYSRVGRPPALVWLAVSLLGCDADAPVTPDVGDASFAASAGSTPAAPSNLASSAVSKSQINLTWADNSTNETGFELQRSTTGPAGTFAPVATTGTNVASYGDAGLTPLTVYCYRVRSFRQTGGTTKYSGFSNTSCTTTPGAPPAPSNADARPASSSAVDITWADNSGTEEGFRVERSAASTGPWDAADTIVANVTSYQDPGRPREQPVCYRVVAFNAHGDSGPSNVDCTAPPAAPTNLTATAAAEPNQGIELRWTDNSAVDDGYEVQRSEDGVTFSTVANQPASSPPYYWDIWATSATTTYWYRVRATKDRGVSDFSNVAAAPGNCVGTESTETVCDNSLDDDCDGFTDTYDGDCPNCMADMCPYGYWCGADGLCRSHCENGAPDYDESDSDCGGSDCRKCEAGQRCNTDFDCASNSCVNNVCQ